MLRFYFLSSFFTSRFSFTYFSSIFKNFRMKAPVQISISSEKFVPTAGILDDGVSGLKRESREVVRSFAGFKSLRRRKYDGVSECTNGGEGVSWHKWKDTNVSRRRVNSGDWLQPSSRFNINVNWNRFERALWNTFGFEAQALPLVLSAFLDSADPFDFLVYTPIHLESTDGKISFSFWHTRLENGRNSHRRRRILHLIDRLNKRFHEHIFLN